MPAVLAQPLPDQAWMEEEGGDLLGAAPGVNVEAS